MLPERTVGKPFGQQAEDHEGAEERHDVGVGGNGEAARVFP